MFAAFIRLVGHGWAHARGGDVCACEWGDGAGHDRSLCMVQSIGPAPIFPDFLSGVLHDACGSRPWLLAGDADETQARFRGNGSRDAGQEDAAPVKSELFAALRRI